MTQNMTREEKITKCAQASHNALVLYCQGIGDPSIKNWDDAEDWQRKDTVAMVEAVIAGKHSPRDQHQRWLESKLAKGYVYGPTKNDDKAAGPLTNPGIVEYDKLPGFQQAKDSLLSAVALGTASYYELVP